MSRLSLLACVAAALFGLGVTPPQALRIRVALHDVDQARYEAFLHGRPCTEVQSFDDPDASRIVVGLVLVCQILADGGVPPKLDFVAMPNYGRGLALVRDGAADLMGDTEWGEYASRTDFLVTSPFNEAGDFMKLIYVRPPLLANLKVEQRADLQKLSFVSDSNWKKDWSTLSDLHVRSLDETVTVESMASMVEAGRVDAALFEVQPGADLAYRLGNVTLLPLPGVKIVLRDTRHFLVSKKSPLGRQLYARLEAGLAQLRARGAIKQALRASGFINPRVESWTALN